MPRRTLAELVVLSPELPADGVLRDASGRERDTVDLLWRVSTRAPRGVQIGGVAAARHYMPTLNLNGLPRLDVTVDRSARVGWWQQIDPALTRVGPEAPSPLLVVHETLRPAVTGEPYASPAETMLDLYALRLDEQAEDLAKTLRRT